MMYSSILLLALAFIHSASSTSDACPEGEIQDCADEDCCPASWLGDGYCDGTDQVYGCDLSCHGNDYGDCSDCPADTIQDCSGDGDCCAASWMGDGYCDGTDQEWGCDLTCYGNDYGDCGDIQGCPEGTIGDCSGDGDCCEASWLGDGYCDGTDQYYGCDLSCYGQDYGDCVAEGCAEGQVQDCADADCCAGSWLGDGYCDGEDQAYGCDLSCYGNDYGDCVADGGCPEGTIQDCSDADCCAASWLGDGYCDGEDQAYGCDLSCYGEEFGDCGDMQGCPEGTMDDCSGDGDCCSVSWLGDGYCDGTDQYYGCDLSCYGADYGDCAVCPPGEHQECNSAGCNCLQGQSSAQMDGAAVAVDDTGILYIVIGCVAGFIALVFCYRMYLRNNNSRFLAFMDKDDPYASVGLEDVPVAEAIDVMDDEDDQSDENANLVPN